MLLTRDEKIERLLLLEEKQRRAEVRRLLDHEDEIRANCRTLIGFIREFWPVLEPVASLKTGWALEAMCAHLEAVTDRRIKRLLMTVPPGMMKSLVLVFWTAWEWGPKGLAHIQVLATSYSQANAFRDNMKLRDLIKSDKFQALWPLEIRDDQDAKGKFANVKSGFSEARPFSKMTGGRANRVKVDDPHDTEAAESEVQRETAVRIMREAISDRVNDPVNDAIVLIMQRLHDKDCAAAAIDLGYVHLNLPMEFDPARRCVTPIFTDPREEEGELLFPERFPAAEVASLKRAKGSYAYAGQYQQSPGPRDGGLFKRSWFRFLDAMPSGNRRRVRAWDLAATKKATGNNPDWTAGVKLSAGTEIPFLIEGVARFRGSPMEVDASIMQHAAADGTSTTVRLTQDPGQAGKAQAETFVRKLAGYPVAVKTATGDKATRATPAAVQCEAGNVYILRTGDPDRDAWIDPFLTELCLFPAAAHDDQVDAFADALNELALGSSYDLDALL